MVRRYYSIRIKLNDVIGENEQIILENIRRCSKIVGKRFKVIFWHEGLTKKNCEDFVTRNKKFLFEVNTKITKNFNHAWFVIDSENEKSGGRYRYDGDILKGIVEYLQIMKIIQKDIS